MEKSGIFSLTVEMFSTGAQKEKDAANSLHIFTVFIQFGQHIIVFYLG